MEQAVQVLVRKPMDMEYSEVTVRGLKDMQAIVEGRIDCIELEHGIDLYINDEYLSLASEDTLNLLIRNGEENRYRFMVYGTIFLAAHGEEGELIPLSEFQRDWIHEHTDVIVAAHGMNNELIPL
ncbi:MAG: DUF3846 domain-containing protein, partial [Paenisporosarcina sp.]|nr:DUF3846 domain-containing protein [Paenisporosarcina sp.]